MADLVCPVCQEEAGSGERVVCCGVWVRVADPVLEARHSDPATSHEAMAETSKGKIQDYAQAFLDLLATHPNGLTDWEVTERIVDTGAFPEVDWLRVRYLATGANNVGGFVRMGRKSLSDAEAIMVSGTRKNTYTTSAGELRSARTARIWRTALKCLPCVMDRHDECDVDTGRSIMPGSCSCADEHAPRPKKRVIQRRKR